MPPRESPLRILFVLENYWPNVGGVETLFRSAAEELARRGHQVTVVTSRLPATSALEHHEGVVVRRVMTPQFLRRYLFMVLALPAVIREAFRANLVHTTTYNAAVPAWIAGVISRRPIVITVHEVFAEQWQQLEGLSAWLGWAYRIYEWLILRLPFRMWICDSDFTRSRLLARFLKSPERVKRIYPSHDATFWDRDLYRPRQLRSEVGAPEDSFIYLYFGRPGVSKGVRELIEAVPAVSEGVPRSRLVMLLSREPADQYRWIMNRLRGLNIQQHVTVLDSVPRESLPGYLLAADCVVVPSISEGFGYAALEAATLRCPVIATSGHSTQEILGDVVTLVPPRNPAALAAAIINASADRKQVPPEPGRFTVEDHVDALERVYREAMAR